MKSNLTMSKLIQFKVKFPIYDYENTQSYYHNHKLNNENIKKFK